MVKDKEYLERFRYIGKQKYRAMWETKNYGRYSKMHIARIVNYYETLKFLKDNNIARPTVFQGKEQKKRYKNAKPKFVYTDYVTDGVLAELSATLQKSKAQIVKDLVLAVRELYTKKRQE